MGSHLEKRKTLTDQLCGILILVVDVTFDEYYEHSHSQRKNVREWLDEFGNVVIIFDNKVSKFVKRTSANDNSQFLVDALVDLKEEYANYNKTIKFLGVEPEKYEVFLLKKFKRLSLPYDTWLAEGNTHFNAEIRYIKIKKDEAV